jgi:RecA/RadA recombinase
MSLKKSRGKTALAAQMKNRTTQEPKKRKNLDGDINKVISTGSTLLDLVICGERTRGGGMPGAIMVEIFGESGTCKTVLLCEIAGSVQRQGGEIKFKDPEGRLSRRFANLFDAAIADIDYDMPNTVKDLFAPIQTWEPKPEKRIHGIFADSLAALSTEMEMEGEDKMGMKRAKDFSEQCRKTCRTITRKGFLMVCSNQVRENADGSPYTPKTATPGGKAVGYYSSLRLQTRSPRKIKKEVNVAGKKVERVVGLEVQIYVFKSSVGIPYRTAPITVIFDYGIDDIRGNLQYLKKFAGLSKFGLMDQPLHQTLDMAIAMVEEQELVQQLKEEVINLWEDIESKFKQERRPKAR